MTRLNAPLCLAWSKRNSVTISPQRSLGTAAATGPIESYGRLVSDPVYVSVFKKK